MKWLIHLTFLSLSRLAFGDFGMDPISQDELKQAGFSNQDEAFIADMPTAISQDTLGNCNVMVGAMLVDKATCDYQKAQGKYSGKCSEMPLERRASRLDFSRFNTPLEGFDESKTGRSDFPGLHLDGGKLAQPLMVALHAGRVDNFMRESCLPMDQFVSKIGSPEEAASLEEAIWNRIKDSYELYQSTKDTCLRCGLGYAAALSKDLEENFNLKVDNKVLLRALAKDSYNKFLDTMLIPKECRGKAGAVEDISPHMLLQTYPQKESDQRTYEGFIAEIKKRLTNQIPIGIGFCAQLDLTATSGRACNGEGHAVVITGYRKICDSKGKCREALQIQNSWGQSWQKNNSDGWVDAKTLLDRTFYENHSLIYLLDNRSTPQGS